MRTFVMVAALCVSVSCKNASRSAEVAQNRPTASERDETPSENAAVRDPPSVEINALIEALLISHEVPAMAAALVTDEGVVAVGAAGVRRMGGPDKVTVHDQFHLGSCTKAMTATMLAKLVEVGSLRWDVTAQEAFPKRTNQIHEQFRAATLEQFASNQSGAHADMMRDGLWGKLFSPGYEATSGRALLTETVLSWEPAYVPGTAYLYSNAGFSIAGYMAERITGTPWEVLMRTHVFDPLNMATAGFGPPGTTDVVDQPRGHTAAGETVEPGPAADNPSAIGPAGTVHASIGDWGKFISVHLAGARQRPRLLRGDSFVKLHTSQQKMDDKQGYARAGSSPSVPGLAVPY